MVVYSFWLSYALLWLVALFILGATTAVIAHLRNGHPPFAINAAPMSVGELLPAFEATNETRRIKISDSDFRGKKMLLLIVSTGCTRCQDMAEGFALLTPDSGTRCLVICVGDSVDCDHYYSSAGAFATLVHDHGGKLAKVFRAQTSPTAMLFDEDGRLEANLSPTGVSEIAKLMNSTQRWSSASGRVTTGYRS